MTELDDWIDAGYVLATFDPPRRGLLDVGIDGHYWAVHYHPCTSDRRQPGEPPGWLWPTGMQLQRGAKCLDQPTLYRAAMVARGHGGAEASTLTAEAEAALRARPELRAMSQGQVARELGISKGTAARALRAFPDAGKEGAA